MRLEPSLSDFAISHQLNSVRGAGSRKSQFLKIPYFDRYPFVSAEHHVLRYSLIWRVVPVVAADFAVRWDLPT